MIICCPHCLKGFEIEDELIYSHNSQHTKQGLTNHFGKANDSEIMNSGVSLDKNAGNIHTEIKKEIEKDYLNGQRKSHGCFGGRGLV